MLRQTARSLATPANMQRAIDAITAKPETSSVIEVGATALKQVATVQKGIPNVYLESGVVNSIIETDLRLAINGGLDKLVLDALATAGFQAPGERTCCGDPQGDHGDPRSRLQPGHADPRPPRPTRRSTCHGRRPRAEAIYVFAPGAQRRLDLGPAPVRLRSRPRRRSLRRLGGRPAVRRAGLVARFEENAGEHELDVPAGAHALFNAERIGAAVRIAAS